MANKQFCAKKSSKIRLSHSRILRSTKNHFICNDEEGFLIAAVSPGAVVVL
jgi:hypothetical protein